MAKKLVCAICGADAGAGWCPYCNGSEPGPSPIKEVPVASAGYDPLTCDNCAGSGCGSCRAGLVGPQ